MSQQISQLFDVTGQVAVVTGGTGVLGGAMARCLAANGAKVAILGRSAEKAKVVLDDIAQAGGEAAFYPADVTDEKNIEGIASEIKAAWGRVDILVNAAGGNNPKATATPDQLFFDLPSEALNGVMKLNIIGTMVPSQVFGRIMTEQKSGNIIN
ncbi:MAG: NAD(P)-dependent dehydrogenase (short-subunit alcohol dehydrogenase family), partial [Kiritimatiellia bacterium]